MAAMASACKIHFQNIDQNAKITKFSDVSLQKVIDFADEWIKLDGEQKCVSESFKTIVNSVEANTLVDNVGLGYHRDCYQRFTNKTNLNRAITRCSSTSSTNEEKTVAKPMTRGSSVSAISHLPTRNPNVLPKVCIICQKTRYEKNVVTGAWGKADLVTCENDGKILIAAAHEKKDEKVLLHIRMFSDLVSPEVNYHRFCYRNYTRSYIDKHISDKSSNEAFELFCSEVITGQLYQDRCCKTVNELFKLQKQYAEKHCGSAYSRKHTLKENLQERFPGLHFFKRLQKNRCELVYFHAQSLAKYMDTHHGHDTDTH